MTDLRVRKLFDPFAVEEALSVGIADALRMIADAIDRGDLAAIDYATGASPCRLQIGHRDDPRSLFRVAVDLAAKSDYVHDPTTQIEGLQECRTNAPAWGVATPPPTAIVSVPIPAASERISPSCKRNDDASSRVKCDAPPAASSTPSRQRS